MNFNKHSNLEGQHAFLSASKYSWLNYDEEKLIRSYKNSFSQSLGTHLHDFAAKRIRFRMKLRKSDVDSAVFYLLDKGLPSFVIEPDIFYHNLMEYVNDGIGYRMSTEQPLVWSENCFGTADSISCSNATLRIHDLKTGLTPASMNQLEIYAALFFLEYASYKPESTNIELRIYQSDSVLVHNPEPDYIHELMTKIVEFDRLIDKIKLEG